MTLLRYVGWRLLVAVPVLLCVVSIIFVVIHVLPGDPAQSALGENASAAAVADLRAKLGLDQPLPLQYARFLGALAHGDLGVSMINGAPVRDQVAHNLPYTLQLTFAALLIGLACGIPLGVLAAIHRNGTPDVLVRLISLGGVSVPAFYLGILLALLFAVQLKWLPAIGASEPSSIVLPALTLGLVMTASITRLVRAAMLEVMSSEFVRTARAKGLRERAVVVLHILRPALLPIVSLTGIWAVALIGDSVTTEVVFSRPGLGKMMVGAMLQRDYTSVQSVMVIYTLFVVSINVLVDLTYGMVDPRTRAGAFA